MFLFLLLNSSLLNAYVLSKLYKKAKETCAKFITCIPTWLKF